VAKDLPEKVEQVIYCEMTEAQEKVYEETKAYYRNTLLRGMTEGELPKMRFSLLQGLMKMRQLANHPRLADPEYSEGAGKLDEVLSLLDTAIQNEHKILVFSSFVKHLQLIKEELEKRKLPFAYLDGTTQNRQAEVERFQQNVNIPVFLISIKAGGVGLNLTAADYVFILDPWWNPAVEAQAIDRAHRIGQENKVMIYKFITQNSVEEKILALQADKKVLAEEIISEEEKFTKQLSQQDFELLLA
jgi:SNF2 family DNA or RNA helicase